MNMPTEYFSLFDNLDECMCKILLDLWMRKCTVFICIYTCIIISLGVPGSAGIYNSLHMADPLETFYTSYTEVHGTMALSVSRTCKGHHSGHVTHAPRKGGDHTEGYAILKIHTYYTDYYDQYTYILYS